jgi:hypothetical protein
MPRNRLGWSRSARQVLVAGALWLCCTAVSIPPDLHMAESNGRLTFSSNNGVLSTTAVCPGYRFDQLDTGGPTFSPDFHWVLVDVLGPFEPGNVPRNHALIYVASGRMILAPQFPYYVGVPATTDTLSWASGRRAALRYTNGKSVTVHDPPLHPLPPERCAPPDRS